jgi:hypothetical protein
MLTTELGDLARDRRGGGGRCVAGYARDEGPMFHANRVMDVRFDTHSVLGACFPMGRWPVGCLRS